VNTLNRILIVVLLLVTMVLCSILLVAPRPILNAISRQAAALVDFTNSLKWYVRIPLGILFALALDIILVLFIIVEVRKPRPKSISVEKVSGGEVQVSVASIADQLKYAVDQLPSVLRAKAKVSSKRGGVVVNMDVETSADIRVPEKAEQIVEEARRVIEEKMGLKLSRSPKVNLRTMPHPKTPPLAREKKKPPSPPGN